MNKYCAIVKDLIWQYTEGECSTETKEFIEDHISECEDCRRLLESIDKVDELVSETIPVEPLPNEKIFKKSFKKIKKRFIATTVALVMLVPIAMSVFLIKNEVNKEGVCFSNIGEIRIARKFAYNIEKGEYENVAKYLDFTRDYRKMIIAKERFGNMWFEDAVIVDKNEDVYAISSEFSELLDKDGYSDLKTDFDEIRFWTVIMMNYPTEAFIPEHIWNQLVTEVYEIKVFAQNALIPRIVDGRECDKMWCFYRHETAFGVYYSVNRAVLGGDCELDSAMVIGMSAILNKEVYDSVNEYIKTNAEKVKEDFFEFYEKELKMTKKEYIEYRREDFVKRMKLYDECGYKFEYDKVKSVYKKDSCWIVELSCIEIFSENGEDEKTKYTIELCIAGGKIIDIRSSAGKTYLFDEILGMVRIEE